MTLAQIHEAGIKALARSLGPVGMVRFLQQYETGQGNYTLERDQWLADPKNDDLLEKVTLKSQESD
jgi:hypothetical protein